MTWRRTSFRTCYAIDRWERIKDVDDIDAYMRRSIINRRNSLLRRVRLSRRTTPVSAPQAGPEPGENLALWDACLRLRPKYRDALVLRFYCDLAYADVAEVLEIRETTARGYVMRALAELRKQWTNFNEEVELND